MPLLYNRGVREHVTSRLFLAIKPIDEVIKVLDRYIGSEGFAIGVVTLVDLNGFCAEFVTILTHGYRR